MKALGRIWLRRICLRGMCMFAACSLAWLLPLCPTLAQPKPDGFWRVDDLRAGMKGQGKTVVKGTKIESFHAEVLGVLKNTSPGRDMVVCRLSGLNLEKTGVIAGMSGSPIYIDGKLVGAVAYAWQFGKEPIAGVTPFSQMHGYVESYERRDLAEHNQPTRIGLRAPLVIDGQEIDRVTVSHDFREPQPTATDGMWLVPLRTPLAATGMSANSLSVLHKQLGHMGLVPMQGGGVGGDVPQADRDVAIEAGGALTVALIQGDFDVSGIGTVTHVEGKRVYGWGHPFFGIGACDFPLMTGFVHAIYPRQNLSFKMGSPLKTVGVINADVSTCIAGWLDRQPDLLPVRMTVSRLPGGQPKTFDVKVVRQRSMVASLIQSALVNSVDMEGDLPEDLTANLKASIEVEGRGPIVMYDTFSGSTITGGRAPQALYAPIAALVNQLTYNAFRNVRIVNVECTTEFQAGRRTADIEAVEAETDTLTPGETLKVVVHLRPYKGPRQRVTVSLPLPTDLAEGNYTATICDDFTSAKQDLRDNPNLAYPPDVDHLFEAVRVQISAKRTHLAVRVPIGGTGVTLGGKSLPNLPGSIVQILGNGRRTNAQTISGALVARQATDWVVQGSDSVRFQVTKNKRTVTP